MALMVRREEPWASGVIHGFEVRVDGSGWLVMGMTREELLLMTDLMRVCRQADTFYLEFTDEALPIKTEEVYALQLIDLGERLLTHAKARKGLVLDGEPTQLVIDAEVVRVDYEPHELPPGREPGGCAW